MTRKLLFKAVCFMVDLSYLFGQRDLFLFTGRCFQ